MTRAEAVYKGSDGEATRRMYSDLESLGLVGMVATCLFRAQKCSSRAKVYRGGIRGQGSYRHMAYGRKNWSIEQLVAALSSCGQQFRWGWRADAATPGYPWVLYVDTPCGQTSFHSPDRLTGPNYEGEWDRSSRSDLVVIQFCDQLLDSNANTVKTGAA